MSDSFAAFDNISSNLHSTWTSLVEPTPDDNPTISRLGSRFSELFTDLGGMVSAMKLNNELKEAGLDDRVKVEYDSGENTYSIVIDGEVAHEGMSKDEVQNTTHGIVAKQQAANNANEHFEASGISERASIEYDPGSDSYSVTYQGADGEAVTQSVGSITEGLGLIKDGELYHAANTWNENLEGQGLTNHKFEVDTETGTFSFSVDGHVVEHGMTFDQALGLHDQLVGLTPPEGNPTGPDGETLNLWGKEDWQGYLTDQAVESLDGNGAFDDYLITFGELEQVGNTDQTEGLSWMEYSNLFTSENIHELTFDLPLDEEAAQTELNKLTPEARQRLEDSGRLDDGRLSAEDLFFARDADGNGQVTSAEFEGSRVDIRDLHLADENVSDETVAAYDAIGAYDDNYISDLEKMQAVEYLNNKPKTA